MQFIRTRIALLFAVTASIMTFVSCSDNPANNGPDTDHVEAFGLVLYNSGAEVVRYQNGVVTGEIAVTEGEDTPLLTVRFLDESGAVIPSDRLSGTAYSLRWEVAQEDIAEVEQHSEDGKWNFHIAGKSEGETTIKIKLFHNDHADFTSKEIPIHVEPAVAITSMKLLLNGVEMLTADTETSSAPLVLYNDVTGTVELKFYDENNTELVLEDHHHVEVVPTDASFVDVAPGTTPGAFTFTTKKTGVTTFRVHLEHEDDHGHGGEPHLLYESPAVTLSIE